jgi:hypothetical protein
MSCIIYGKRDTRSRPLPAKFPFASKAAPRKLTSPGRNSKSGVKRNQHVDVSEDADKTYRSLTCNCAPAGASGGPGCKVLGVSDESPGAYLGP